MGFFLKGFLRVWGFLFWVRLASGTTTLGMELEALLGEALRARGEGGMEGGARG